MWPYRAPRSWEPNPAVAIHSPEFPVHGANMSLRRCCNSLIAVAVYLLAVGRSIFQATLRDFNINLLSQTFHRADSTLETQIMWRVSNRLLV